MDGDSWIRAAACGDLADGEALAVPAPDGRTIALFFTDGGYHAIDNQCPHMGFPLVRGLVRNGTVTCDWHGRSFDLAGGGCFHSQCDDVRVFETEIRDGSVWIRAEAEADDRREARLRLLWEGLLGDDRWTMSKAIAQLLHGGVPEADIVELVVRHVGRHIASSHDLDAGDDVSRLINGLKVGQRYEGEERLIALAIAARSATGPAAERNENVPMPPPYDWERTARWVRSFSCDRMGNRIGTVPLHGMDRGRRRPHPAVAAPAHRRPRPLHHGSATQQQQRLRNAHRKAFRPTGDGGRPVLGLATSRCAAL